MESTVIPYLHLKATLFHHESERLGVSLFGVVRNLFNGKQYFTERWPNAPRYAEAGLKLRF